MEQLTEEGESGARASNLTGFEYYNFLNSYSKLFRENLLSGLQVRKTPFSTQTSTISSQSIGYERHIHKHVSEHDVRQREKLPKTSDFNSQKISWLRIIISIKKLVYDSYIHVTVRN